MPGLPALLEIDLMIVEAEVRKCFAVAHEMAEQLADQLPPIDGMSRQESAAAFEQGLQRQLTADSYHVTEQLEAGHLAPKDLPRALANVVRDFRETLRAEIEGAEPPDERSRTIRSVGQAALTRLPTLDPAELGPPRPSTLTGGTKK